jgi:UDP-N-acetylglucosamine 2-epimerase (non-hydrolysing)
MLDALAHAQVVVTDSGGLQEEASWFGVPVVVLRTSTPRWEGVVDGTARLVGLDVAAALAAAAEMTTTDALARAASLPCPYGDGHVSPRVVATVHAAAALGLLRLDEPVLGGPLPIDDLLATERPGQT